MKKLFALVLALVMALSLVACGGSSSGSGQASSGASGNKVVKIGVVEPQTGANGRRDLRRPVGDRG